MNTLRWMARKRIERISIEEIGTIAGVVNKSDALQCQKREASVYMLIVFTSSRTKTAENAGMRT